MGLLLKTGFHNSYKYFKLGNNLNQRDVIAVKKTVSGLAKRIHPEGQYTRESVEEILRFALELRRRVKELGSAFKGKETKIALV